MNDAPWGDESAQLKKDKAVPTDFRLERFCFFVRENRRFPPVCQAMTGGKLSNYLFGEKYYCFIKNNTMLNDGKVLNEKLVGSERRKDTERCFMCMCAFFNKQAAMRKAEDTLLGL